LTWDARREQYYFHQFLKEQPNVNLWNPDVRKAIKEIAAFWLDMGVDGFRLDTIQTYLSDQKLRDNPPCPPGQAADMPSNNPMSRQLRKYTANLAEVVDFIEEIRNFIDQWPDRCLLAEVGGDDPERAAADVQTGHRCHMAYSFALIGTSMSMNEVLRPVRRVEELLNDGWFCWATSNHDSKRVATRMKGNAPAKDKAVFATMLGLSLRGSYYLYEGEELGLPQAELAFEDLVDPYDIMLYPHHVGRDGCRTPMPWHGDVPQAGFSTAQKTWLPIPAEHAALAVDVQEKNPDSVLHGIRSFIAWRKKHDALRLGSIEILNEVAEPVLASAGPGKPALTRLG
jgi:alpha-glucosidase